MRSPTAASTCTSVDENGRWQSLTRNRRSPVAASAPSGIHAAEHPVRPRRLGGVSASSKPSRAIGAALSTTSSALGPRGQPSVKPSSSASTPTASVSRSRSPRRSATQTTSDPSTSAISASVRRTIASGAAGAPIAVSNRTSRAVMTCSPFWVKPPMSVESSEDGPTS